MVQGSFGSKNFLKNSYKPKRFWIYLKNHNKNVSTCRANSYMEGESFLNIVVLGTFVSKNVCVL